jgi:cytoskeletal protein RodZ
MKLRAITFAFGALFVSSLAFADNPTDAPLMPNDGNADVRQQENCTGHNHQHPNRKGESRSPKAKNENPSKDNRQREQSNPQYPATANN